MASFRTTHADFLKDSRILIENAAGIPEIAASLASYGYNAARFEEGRSLWAEADALAKKQLMDSGESHGAVQDQDEAWAEANATYIKTLKVARLAFGDDARAITSLMLMGPRKQTIAGWFKQASTFYGNLTTNSALAARLERYGYTAAKLQSEAARVDAFGRRMKAKTEGSGTAQASIVARDKKLHELDSWVSELRTIARVAFYEEPQELEKLGVIVLNGPRRSAKRAEAARATSGASGQ